MASMTTGDSWGIENIIGGSLLTIVTLAMFVGNLAALVVILHSRRLRQIPSYWFIINLTLTDLLWSVSVMPIATIWEFYDDWPFSSLHCRLHNMADVCLSAACVYSILIITLDKYFYIRKPWLYDRVMKLRRALIVIGALWTGCIVGSVYTVVPGVAIETNTNDTSCIFIMTDAYAITAAMIVFFLPFLILFALSLRILIITRKHLRRIGEQRASVCSVNITYALAQRGQIFIRTSWKTIALTMSVVFAFTLMEAPYWILCLTAALCSNNCIDRVWIDEKVAYLYYINPMVNPVIYLLTDRRYRSAARDLVRRFVRQPSVTARASLTSTEHTSIHSDNG